MRKNNGAISIFVIIAMLFFLAFILVSYNVVQEKGKTADVETLEVHFADGKVFKNVKYDKENLDKIIKRQEEQAAQGVENLPVFKRRLTLSGIMAAASIVGGPFIAANVVPAVEQAMQVESDPTRISLATEICWSA